MTVMCVAPPRPVARQTKRASTLSARCKNLCSLTKIARRNIVVASCTTQSSLGAGAEHIRSLDENLVAVAHTISTLGSGRGD